MASDRYAVLVENLDSDDADIRAISEAELFQCYPEQGEGGSVGDAEDVGGVVRREGVGLDEFRASRSRQARRRS